MSKKKKRKYDLQKDILSAFKKANRDLQFERNGGGQFVAMNRVFKSKKQYDRKRDRKIDLSDGLFNFI